MFIQVLLKKKEKKEHEPGRLWYIEGDLNSYPALLTAGVKHSGSTIIRIQHRPDIPTLNVYNKNYNYGEYCFFF